LSEVISCDSCSKAGSNLDLNLPRHFTFKVLQHYGPLQGIWLCALGHRSIFGDAQWAIAMNLLMHYGPQWQIWLRAMEHCVE
jgi:hypothetical protein